MNNLFKLQELRHLHNYSCRDMALRLNISKTFYWQLENRNRRLSYEMAFKISELFGLKPDVVFYKEFLDRREEENEK